MIPGKSITIILKEEAPGRWHGFAARTDKTGHSWCDADSPAEAALRLLRMGGSAPLGDGLLERLDGALRRNLTAAGRES